MQRIQYKKEGLQNYMVIPCEKRMQGGYSQRLLQYHSIPYILPCECRIMDGQQMLYYKLQYRTTLKTILPYLPLNKRQVINMLRSIAGVLEAADEYLLDAEGLIWRTDCIFVEADTGKLKFCYMWDAQEAEGSFCGLITELIQAVSKKEESHILLLQFYDLITEPDCSLADIKKYIGEKCNILPEEKNLPRQEMPYIKEQDKMQQKTDKKTDNNKEKDTSKGIRIITALLVLAAGINILLILCLLLNILTYEAMRYLFVTMGFLIFMTILYMNMQKEESPDEIMQAYFEEQASGFDKDERDLQNSETGLDYAGYSMPETDDIKEHTKEAVPCYGETTVLTKGEENPDMEMGRPEQEKQHLYLEALEQGRYKPIHIHNSVILGCMAEGCNYILKDRGISRMHAKLMEKADGLYLLDLNSTNGTYLNGEMLESGEDYKIEEGDLISFAKSEFYAAVEV